MSGQAKGGPGNDGDESTGGTMLVLELVILTFFIVDIFLNDIAVMAIILAKNCGTKKCHEVLHKHMSHPHASVTNTAMIGHDTWYGHRSRCQIFPF